MLQDTKIRIISLPLPLRMGLVNCYLVRTEGGDFLIDTGSSNARRALEMELHRAGCHPPSLKLVLLTHGDFDHIGNACFLRSAFATKLAMHPDDSGMAEYGDMFFNRKTPNLIARTLMPHLSGFGASERFIPDLILEDGYDLTPLGLHARVVSLPGHSKGSIGILTSTGDFFCGDLLANTRHPEINSIMDDLPAARASVAKLREFNPVTIYPGHGHPFALEALGAGSLMSK